MNQLKVESNNGIVNVSAPKISITSAIAKIRQIIGAESSIPLDNIKFETNLEPDSSNSPQIRKIIHTIHPEIPEDAPENDLKKIACLHLDKFEAAANSIPPQQAQFTKGPITVPTVVAAFLVELFDLSQNQNTKHNVDKGFAFRPVFSLSVPIVVHVLMEAWEVENKVDIYFSDVGPLDFQVASDLINNAIVSLSKMNIAITKYNKVDLLGFGQNTQNEWSQQIQVPFLKSDDQLSTSGNERDFTLYTITSSFSEDQLNQFKDKCEKLFFKIQLRECNECHKIISDVQQDECIIYEHDGDIIPFEDGQKEHNTIDADGSPIVLINYSCCGEAVKGDNSYGCIEVPLGQHTTVPDQKISSWEFTTTQIQKL